MDGTLRSGGTMIKMPSLIYIMITMFDMDRSNGVNVTGVSDKGTSPGRVAGGQQQAPGRHPATAMQGNRSGKGKRRPSIEENKVVVECYFKGVLDKRGYRQRMVMWWEVKGMFKVIEQRLADQTRAILKSNWLTTVELEEIKRNADGDEQRMSSATEFASAGIGNEVLDETMEEVDSGREYEDLVHEEPYDERPEQFTDDQRVIWNSLNEIRLRQAQNKVPALKGILKQRIKEELRTVEEVAVLLPTRDIMETNRLLYAIAVVVTKRLGIKPTRRRETKEPWWERRLKGQLDQLRKDLGRLEQIRTNECNRQTIKTHLWRKYNIKAKGIDVVIEELKQRVTAKAHKIKRYSDRILQYKQKRLFETNQRQFYKELDDPKGDEQPIRDAAESRQLCSNLWDQLVKHRRDPDGLKEQKEQTQAEQQNDLIINLEKLGAALRKIPNWKASGPDNLQEFWLKNMTKLHERKAIQLQERLEGEGVPRWMTKGRTVSVIKDQTKGNAVGNYRPITLFTNYVEGTYWDYSRGFVSTSHSKFAIT